MDGEILVKPLDFLEIQGKNLKNLLISGENVLYYR